MEKMRATHHSGRKSKKGAYSTKHNDRNFDLDLAKNIDQNKTQNNIYWNCYDKTYKHKDKADKMSFEEVEAKYYSRTFKRQWCDVNMAYERQRHPERCKSFEDWCKQDQNLPEELYLQIGDSDNHVTDKQMYDVFVSYYKKLMTWSKQHGNPFQILDFSFHFDEKVPQVHLRRVWQYKNADGVTCIGQDKALEQAGVPLPNPNKKRSRHNNRKMTFDKIAREMYLEACREHGLEIEEVPLVDVTHNKTKEQVLDEKLKRISDLEAKKEAELEEQKKVTEKLQERLKTANKDDTEVYKAYLKSRGLQADFKAFYMAYGEETEIAPQQPNINYPF